MAKNLVIVESPAKAKTIQRFLGSNYEVMASNGHVRDLPKSQMGVDLEHDFEPKYITIRGKGELVNTLKKEAKKVDRVYLATDPDREGEAISWHLAHVLELPPETTRRITFNEITKTAVRNSLKNARDIDQGLVDAQQARRVLDRLVGYQISPVLWKKVQKGLSAGRVQSAALKLLCDRENEIADFVQEEFWTIDAVFTKQGAKGNLSARLTKVGRNKATIANQGQSDDLIRLIRACGDFAVQEIKRGHRLRKAPLPFTTSTLQQEASKRIGFTPSKTMQIAQQLYEGVTVGKETVGLITYLRTDSTRVAVEAHEAAVNRIRAVYGEEYVGDVRGDKSGGRIQDAHEAIRPTHIDFAPSDVQASLSRDQFRLYQLIYDRFMASRMAPARYDTIQVILLKNGFEFTSSGSKLQFPGFLKVYKEDDEQEPFHMIDGLQEGDMVQIKDLKGEQHFTQPPARYTEAALVRALEENGVGRPSTYAPTISTLLTRSYVAKEKKALYVTELGKTVNQMICQYFQDIVDIGFTAGMEEKLDRVEEGEAQWKQVIGDFYKDFAPLVEKANTELEKVKLPVTVTDVICDKCGRNMVLKTGRFGKFYACPGFPECRNIKPYQELLDVPCPQCGAPLQVKHSHKGRIFYGCTRYPACDFVAWDKPVAKKCPRCGSYMVEKNGRQARIVCASKECGYSEKKESEE
ncbi:MAG: type I DNA topoisomerase [Firmicutes bacterium]|nr:type I DNA topoisomerase [Bacillota bacterium]